MTTPVTVLAPITLAEGRTEADLLAASEIFQKDFCNDQPGIIRRELVRKNDGQYFEIVQFRSAKDMEDVMEKEQESAACKAFFAVMKMEDMDDTQIEIYSSLATYT